jgi:hypothetical protein
MRARSWGWHETSRSGVFACDLYRLDLPVAFSWFIRAGCKEPFDTLLSASFQKGENYGLA